MKFYYIYILHNHLKNFIYVGFSEDLKTRLKSHNKGENKSTKAYIPLELIHYEAYKNIVRNLPGADGQSGKKSDYCK